MGKVEEPISNTIILLSLVGTTPAVLTETVWALAHQLTPVVPNRVVALTTGPGRDLLADKLFAEGRWEAMKAAISANGVDVDDKLRFGPIADCIRAFPDATRSRELEDVRTVEENEAVAEFFMEVVRGFTENESIQLIVSIAGGRKTSSALLHSVMTLLGRAQDKITHVIVDDCWVANRDFFYPGCEGTFTDPASQEALDSADAQLDLVEVPFVPIRYLFGNELKRSTGSYLALMRELRTRTLNLDEDLEVKLSIASGELEVNGRPVSLSPNEFLLYLYFAKRAKAIQPALDAYVAMDGELEALRDEHRTPNDLSHWSQKCQQETFDTGEDLKKLASSIRGKLKSLNTLDEAQIKLLVPYRGNLRIDLPSDAINLS